MRALALALPITILLRVTDTDDAGTCLGVLRPERLDQKRVEEPLVVLNQLRIKEWEERAWVHMGVGVTHRLNKSHAQ